MSFQVGNGSLGGTVFFSDGTLYPLQTMKVKAKKWPKMTKRNVSLCISGTVSNMIVVFGTRVQNSTEFILKYFLRDGKQYIDKVYIGQFSPQL